MAESDVRAVSGTFQIPWHTHLATGLCWQTPSLFFATYFGRVVLIRPMRAQLHQGVFARASAVGIMCLAVIVLMEVQSE
jgi:hypothetical protein